MFKKYLSLLLCLTVILSGVSFSVYASRKADDPGLENGNSEEGMPDATSMKPCAIMQRSKRCARMISLKWQN